MIHVLAAVIVIADTALPTMDRDASKPKAVDYRVKTQLIGRQILIFRLTPH